MTDTGELCKAQNNNVHLKVLIPSVAAGAIIGKNGEAIIQVSKQTGAKIKLSKADDFYPGTTERVCLIQGNLEAVTKMHMYIMDRIYEKSESLLTQPSTQTKTSDSISTVTLWSSGQRPNAVAPTKIQWERHQQVKILVPNCTAGLIIGKKGAFVNVIKQETGAWVQVSQKSEHVDLTERCITIAGDKGPVRAALDMILCKIAEDPQSSTCSTISYSNISGPVASAHPVGSPYAFNNQNLNNISTDQINLTTKSSKGQIPALLAAPSIPLLEGSQFVSKCAPSVTGSNTAILPPDIESSSLIDLRRPPNNLTEFVLHHSFVTSSLTTPSPVPSTDNSSVLLEFLSAAASMDCGTQKIDQIPPPGPSYQQQTAPQTQYSFHIQPSVSPVAPIPPTIYYTTPQSNTVDIHSQSQF